MPRPTKADEGRARACLLAAGVEVAAEFLEEHDGDGSTIDFPIDRVLQRAGEFWDGDGTRGAFARTTLSRHFETVDNFRAEVMAALHAADLSGVEHLDEYSRRVVDPLIDDERMPQVRAAFSKGDLHAMVAAPSRSRQWFELHSRAARVPRYAQILLDTYAAYDGRLRPLLQGELERRRRRVREGMSVEDVLVCLTALTEGLAMRSLSDPGLDPDHLEAVAAMAAESIILGLTGDPSSA